jgi:hypothetical protein
MSFKLISSGSNSANRQTKKTTPIRESLNNEEDSFCDENLTSQTRNNERGKSTEKDGILKRVLPGQKIQFFCQCFYKHDPEKLMQESSKFLRHFFSLLEVKLNFMRFATQGVLIRSINN